MQRIILLLSFFSLFVFTCSANPSETNVPAQFVSEHIEIVGQAIPFQNYQAWLEEVKKHAKSSKMVTRFKKVVDANTTDARLSNTQSYWIEYQSDGLKIAGVMAFPADYSGEKLPVVIYNRGGNMKHNVSRVQLLNRLLPIAEQGYLVLASNYRGSRYSEGKDEFGGADVNDVLRLIELSKSIPASNPEKLAVFGWSRGGMMTWQTLRKNKNDIKTAIIGAGLTDAFFNIKRRPEMGRLMQHMIPNFEENKEAELTNRSAILWLDELNTDVPILLLHGDKDLRVDVSQSRRAAARLKTLEHPHQYIEYPDDNHGLNFHSEEVEKQILAWLDKHLK